MFTFQLPIEKIVSPANAQGGDLQAQGFRIKYVYEMDYPVGRKGEYLLWTGNIAKKLKVGEGLKRVVSYQNYFASSPHYVIEFEFDSLVDAGKYFEGKKIKKILDSFVNRSTKASIKVLELRDDYLKK